MPKRDPIQSPRASLMRRFWRIFRLLILFSVVIAGIALALVTQGPGEIHPSLIIATAFGVGLTVLVGTSLMTLVFLSDANGHDQDVSSVHKEKDSE